VRELEQSLFGRSLLLAVVRLEGSLGHGISVRRRDNSPRAERVLAVVSSARDSGPKPLPPRDPCDVILAARTASGADAAFDRTEHRERTSARLRCRVSRLARDPTVRQAGLTREVGGVGERNRERKREQHTRAPRGAVLSSAAADSVSPTPSTERARVNAGRSHALRYIPRLPSIRALS
jgi:hypothetical protein